MQPVCSKLSPSSAELKAVAPCQPFSRLLNLWCANNGLEASNKWCDNVLEEPPIFQLRLGQSRRNPEIPFHAERVHSKKLSKPRIVHCWLEWIAL